MDVDLGREAPSVLALRRAFESLCAFDRASRAIEALAVALAVAWLLLALAQSTQSPHGTDAAHASAARAPAYLAALLAGASWWIERQRSADELARRADRKLAAEGLVESALEHARSARRDGWSELVCARALQRWDRELLRSSSAPKWILCAALLLTAFGLRELGVELAGSAPAELPAARAWSTLAETVERAPAPNAAAVASDARAELVRALRAAAEAERSASLAPDEARALLERAEAVLASEASASASPSAANPLAGALAELRRDYPPSAPGPSRAGDGGRPSAGTAAGQPRAGTDARSVPSGAADGTMGGSTANPGVAVPAPPASGGAQTPGLERASLAARWWPREQDGLVEAWIEQSHADRNHR